MSQSSFRCPNCPGVKLFTVLEAVQHVMKERGTGKGTRGTPVPCCIQGCHKTVHRLRLHIRKCHKALCPVHCPCQARFVERKDWENHRRNKCPLRLAEALPLISVDGSGDGQCSNIDEFFKKIDFSNPSATNESIAEHLQLDEDSRNNVSSVLDKLYQHIQHHMPSSYSVHNLIKGGSVGKGTAVRNKADIDCVVFLNKFKTMKDHKRHLKKTKNDLETCLRQSPPYKVEIGVQSPFAVKFKLYLESSQEFDVDLLPTFTTDVKCRDQRYKLYEEMVRCSEDDRRFYSAALVQLQVDFVKKQPANVKDLIRLVKYWRKTCIEDRSNGLRLPSSYLLELISIHCWEEAGKPHSFDIRAGFKTVLRKLVNYGEIRAVWYDNYSRDIAIKEHQGTARSSGPFVLDPANPTNNVCSASDAEGLQTVAKVAEATLERLDSPAFEFITSLQ